MKYLRKFDEISEFVSATTEDDIELPNVSLVYEDTIWNKEVYYSYLMTDISNPEMMDIARSAGWVGPTDTAMTYAQAFAVTTEQFNNANVIRPDSSGPNGYVCTFKDIKHFDEFEYFTNVTALTWTSNGDTADTVYHGSFFNATKLETVKLPQTLRLTQRNTFMNCSSLENVGMSKAIKQLGRNCFVYCWKLKHLELPEGLNVISESCFVYSGLGDTEPLMLPTSITYLGATSCPIYWYRKFNETLDFPRIRYFGQENFINQIGPRNLIMGANLETLGVGDHEYTQHYNDVFWDTLESVTISPDCENFKTINNVVYTKDGVYCYGGADYGLSKQEVLELEEGTQKIVSGAFRTFFSYDDSAEACPWCHREDMILRRVIFPSTLVQIGYCCFQYSMPFEVVCKAVTPPKRLYGVFASGVGNIYVPDESVDAYKAAQYWSGNKNKIKPMSELPEL